MSNDNNEIIEMDEIELTDKCVAIRHPTLEGDDIIRIITAGGNEICINKKDISLMYHKWVEVDEVINMVDFERLYEIEIVGTGIQSHDWKVKVDKREVKYVSGLDLNIDGAPCLAKLTVRMLPQSFFANFLGKIKTVGFINSSSDSDKNEVD